MNTRTIPMALMPFLISGCSLFTEQPNEHLETNSLEHVMFGDSTDCIKWTLISIDPDGHGYIPVSDSSSHVLVFSSNNAVTYHSQDHQCTGTYEFIGSGTTGSIGALITLHLPCIIPDEGHSWEYLVKESDGAVYVRARLKPSWPAYSLGYYYSISGCP